MIKDDLILQYVQYTGCFKKNTPKSLRDMSKTKNKKPLGWTHVLYIPSSFISCFTSAQCGHHRQHGRHQADMKIHPKHASACCGPPS